MLLIVTNLGLCKCSHSGETVELLIHTSERFARSKSVIVNAEILLETLRTTSASVDDRKASDDVSADAPRCLLLFIVFPPEKS